MFTSITHVIYDLDGLLLNTESLHERVNQIIAERYGKTFKAAAKVKIAGRPTLDSASILVEMLGLPMTAEAYIEERKELLYPLYATTQPLPGTVRLTKHLKQHNIPQAIATSSSKHHFELKTAHHQEWFKLFDRLILGDDPAIRQGKPAPDIFLLAAKRLNASPARCLVFEDSVAGMKAALAAGMSVVVVPDPVFERQLYQNAHQILNSLTKFEPQLWYLPGFDN